MKRRRITGLAAVGAVAALGLAACGGGSSGGGERTFDRSLFPLGPAYYTFLLGGNAKTHAKSLIYRSPQLTNVYVQRYYAMYNYAVLGLKS